MNLYYAVTNYHLLCCVLHALFYHKDDKNVLYLSCWHPEHETLIERIKKKDIFERVEIFKEVVFPSGNKKISDEQIEMDINKIIGNIPNDFINDVIKSKEINIAGDNYCASVYLQQRRIKYNYLEEACGVLSDEERLKKIIKKIDYSRYQILDKLELPGNHEYIEKRYGDLGSQLKGYSNEKDVHFSVIDILKTLSKKEIKKIVQIFSDEEVIVVDESMLLLTFHYINMNLLALDEQRYLYSILVDYFFKGKNLVIKQHPSDIQPDYCEWFSDSLILPREMPSELLPFLTENKFSRVLTSYSTSVFAMKSYCDDVISFGMYIEKNFRLIHEYYVVMNLLNFISNYDYEIIGVGLDQEIVKNILYQYNFKNINVNFINNINDIDKDKKSILIIDDYKLSNDELNNLINGNVVFFINEDNWIESVYNNPSKDLINNSSSILLSKEIVDESKWNCDDNLYKFIVYYCDNDDLKHKIFNFSLEKTLKNCNITIKAESNILKTNMFLKEKISILSIKEKNKEEETKELKNKIDDLNNKLNENSIKIDKLNNEIKYYENLYNEIINSSSWKITKLYRKIGGEIKKIMKEK